MGDLLPCQVRLVFHPFRSDFVAAFVQFVESRRLNLFLELLYFHSPF